MSYSTTQMHALTVISNGGHIIHFPLSKRSKLIDSNDNIKILRYSTFKKLFDNGWLKISSKYLDGKIKYNATLTTKRIFKLI